MSANDASQQPDGSIVDAMRKVIFFSEQRFLRDVVEGDRCFICGADPREVPCSACCARFSKAIVCEPTDALAALRPRSGSLAIIVTSDDACCRCSKLAGLVANALPQRYRNGMPAAYLGCIRDMP